MYAYQDQYGWAIGCYSDAGRDVWVKSWNAPRTFATRADAERWIREAA